jgi:hypothetical protein
VAICFRIRSSHFNLARGGYRSICLQDRCFSSVTFISKDSDNY